MHKHNHSTIFLGAGFGLLFAGIVVAALGRIGGLFLEILGLALVLYNVAR